MQEVHDLFSKYGTVLRVRIAKDYVTGRKRSFGFVTMKNDALRDAIFNRIHFLGGKRIDIRRENDATSTDFPRKVFVGGLHPSWGVDELTT